MDKLRELVRERFENKSLVLLGFGREGQSSYQFLRQVFPGKEISIADLNPAVREASVVQGDSLLQFITGEGYLDTLGRFDVIMRSPGIPVWQRVGNPVGGDPSCKGPGMDAIPAGKITSQTSLFLECYAGQVTGVTGTKGKSTTSSLIHHIFRTAGLDSILAGNIGNPVFNIAHLIKPATRIVLELSSHQLEYLVRAPATAVFLNLFQEHLDAYADYDSYQRAKANIVGFQRPGDRIIYNADDERVVKHVMPWLDSRQCFPFSLLEKPANGGFPDGGYVVFSEDGVRQPVWRIHQDRFLRGIHNLKNILAASTCAMLAGLDPENIADGILTFKGLEHRLEYVGEFGGIHFYNDSIATIPEACMEAVRAIPDVDTLVAGGFDRGIDYSELALFLASSQVRNIILVGEAGLRIGALLESCAHQAKSVFPIQCFDEFRTIAFRETRPGSVCLLSPAAASYDEFNNFEERGKRFRELVSGKVLK